jgi:hypothetical protein
MVGECLCEIEVAVQLGSNDCKHLGPQHSAESIPRLPCGNK